MATEKLQEALYYIEATVLHATTTAASRGGKQLGHFALGLTLLGAPGEDPSYVHYHKRSNTLIEQSP